MRDLVRLPKAHLHVHLENTIRWSTLTEIGTANGVVVPDPAAVAFDNFGGFADHNALIRDCLRRPEDFARIAEEFCQDEAANGTGYAEVTFTAAAHGERLADPDMPLQAVLDGLAAGRAAYGIESGVILDHSRRRSVERAWRTLELAIRHREAGVVAIGVAGDEASPLHPFAAVFDAARDAGLHLVHHAGETGGPGSIREAIQLGHAERLGHGVRVLEDDRLVAEVRRRRLPLEVCPSSNVALGVAGSWATHPWPQLRAAGLIVTLNTDIPAIVGTSLAEEYRRVRDTFDVDDRTLAHVAVAGIDASFAPPSSKARLRDGVAAWLAAPGGPT